MRFVGTSTRYLSVCVCEHDWITLAAPAYSRLEHLDRIVLLDRGLIVPPHQLFPPKLLTRRLAQWMQQNATAHLLQDLALLSQAQSRYVILDKLTTHTACIVESLTLKALVVTVISDTAEFVSALGYQCT
jgi:hypothetical protein